MASWSTGASGGGSGGVDATYGQRSVFGAVGLGLAATAPADDADLDCEDEQEALAYLQRVQAEARKIPHVVLAPEHGPQVFPPRERERRPRRQNARPDTRRVADESSATINKKRRRRRRLRHWDELDDGVPRSGSGGDGDESGGRTSKRRRMATAPAVATGLSYDDNGGDKAEEVAAATEASVATFGQGGGRLVRRYADDDSSQDEEDEEGSDEDDEDDDDSEETGDNGHDGPQPGRSSIYHNGVGDARGFYQDGAYIAAARGEEVATPATPEAVMADGPADARFTTAYRARLLAHFAALRAVLRRDVPAAAVAALPPDHDTDIGALSVRSGAFRRWLYLLRTTDPLPAQVAALDKIGVLRVLRVVLRGLFYSSSRGTRFGPGSQNDPLDLTPRTSRWLWALFARLPARGELDHREVGYIREVAKQAVLRLAHLSYDVQGGATGGQQGPDGQDEQGDETSVPSVPQDGAEEEEDDCDDMDMEMAMDLEPEEDQAEAEEALTPEEAFTDGDGPDEYSEASDLQQRATLEMVLTVVGEFYGQRDLLAFRSPWPQRE